MFFCSRSLHHQRNQSKNLTIIGLTIKWDIVNLCTNTLVSKLSHHLFSGFANMIKVKCRRKQMPSMACTIPKAQFLANARLHPYPQKRMVQFRYSLACAVYLRITLNLIQTQCTVNLTQTVIISKLMHFIIPWRSSIIEFIHLRTSRVIPCDLKSLARSASSSSFVSNTPPSPVVICFMA